MRVERAARRERAGTEVPRSRHERQRRRDLKGREAAVLPRRRPDEVPEVGQDRRPVRQLEFDAEQAKLVGQEGKPESYYFPPQHNPTGNNFPYTFMGFEPGTTKAQVRKCLEDWNKGDNGILDLSKAYRLKPGTGWLIHPSILHAPGSLCTYEPQWGSDVFGMYQSLVEGREVPWALLVKDMPKNKHKDLDFIVDQVLPECRATAAIARTPGLRS